MQDFQRESTRWAARSAYRRSHRGSVQAGTLALLCLLLLGCTGAPEPLDSYFPTEQGKRWNYRLTRTTMDGTRIRPYYIEHRGPALIPGLSDLLEEQRTFDGNRYFYLRDPENGWLRVAVQSAVDDTPRLAAVPRTVLPARLLLGEHWRQTTPVRVLEKTGPPQETLFRLQIALPVDYRITAIDERVEVPAGIFTRCLRVEGRGSISTHLGNYLGIGTVDVHSTEWFAPGVGLIRHTLEERTNRQALDRGSLLLELTSVSDH